MATALATIADRVVDVLELELTSRRLRVANERLGAFAGQVSHDLKNPLAAIRMSVELARDEVPGEDAALVGLLDRAERGAQRMDAMISELLSFARGGGDPVPVDVDLGVEMSHVLEDLDGAIAYYRDRLGFALDFQYESFYASVSRDGFAIHLKHGFRLAGEREHRRQNEHLDAFVAVTGVQTLHQEFQTRGAHIIKPIGQRPWDCVDFYVEDADGYVLCFSEQTPHREGE